jgi:serine/threonine-protein kinase
LKALYESRELRAALYGASNPVVGETDRMIGEVIASSGRIEEATPYFDRAVKLTRVGYGEADPRALFAELSMARQQARLGNTVDALARLDALSTHEGTGSEIPKLRWRARAYAAEARCRSGQREHAQRDLDALLHELHAARSEGGVITREAQAIRAACE